MRVFRSLEALPRDFGPTVISIGNFDGVHSGHRQVLGEVVRRANELKAKSVAVTFDPHPARVLRPESALLLITPNERKLELLEDTGIDAVVVVPFTPQFAQTPPDDFARGVVVERLRALEVHEGANFRYGRNAEGDVTRLGDFGAEFGFAVRVYRELKVRGDVVSSSRIRQLLREGKLSRANRLLGQPFALRGTPAKGRGYGTKYFVPTINLAPYLELLPQNGVYITRTWVGDEEFASATNVGLRPTMGDGTVVVETHLLDYRAIEINEGTSIEVEFLYRLRDEVKFETPEALKAEIVRDVERTRRYFRRLSAVRV